MPQRAGEPRFGSAGLLLAVFVLALACWALLHVGRPWYLTSGDAHVYAEIGRRLASGRGFSVGSLYPAELVYGVTQDHPSLLRAPLWPLVIAGFFSVLGPEPGAVRVALLLLFVGNAVAAAALAHRIGGWVPGAAAGIAVATSPLLLAFTLDGLSELLFALLLTLVLLLCVDARRPVVLGALCGLAYLARPNGLATLPAALLLLLLQQRRLRPPLLCAVTFALVASPWWIRNWIVAGSPWFSLYAWVPWYLLDARQPFQTLLHVLEPSRGHPLAVHPIEKFSQLLPELLARWPPASMNLAACLGVGLASARLHPPTLAFALLAVATTGAAALAAVLGRYFVPLLPGLLALGAAAWWLHGRRLRWPGLALLLAAPLLPAVPAELTDLGILRTPLHRASPAPPRGAGEAARCLEDRPLVMAPNAGMIAWETGALAIHPVARRADFWEIVERYPVRFVSRWRGFPVPRAELESRFRPRPDCGPGFYERIDVPVKRPPV